MDMDTTPLCPGCGKPLERDAPKGLCPECLMKGAFQSTAAGGSKSGRFEPPPVEEVATLFPQLDILSLIGQGGMGAVYKARQPALDRFVALKVLSPAMADDPGFAERFNREARALARLSHPNIVTVYDFGKAGTLHYLLMEFVDGANLREVEQSGKLSSEQALAIVPQICEALQFAHNEGIVHRDIKPENLLLDKKGRLKITDFGIAKILGVPAGKTSLTGARDVVGTPHYMAPEQIEKPQNVDHRADIYSLGVVFYEMLTGELPLGKFAPPSRKVQVDVRLDEVVLHTLEKEPERRYQQASHVKTDVETITATPPPIIPSAGFAAAAGPGLSASPAGRGPGESEKAIVPAFLLAFFFGIFGAHRFYVGRIWTGLLQLAGLGACVLLVIACATTNSGAFFGVLLAAVIVGCGVWATIDWILILCKAFTDHEGGRLTRWWHPEPGRLDAGGGTYRGEPPRTIGEAASGAREPVHQGPSTPLPAGTRRIPNVMITAPAIGLMVAGALKLLSAFKLLVLLSPAGREWLDSFVPGWDAMVPSHFGGWMEFDAIVFHIIPGLLILFGGFEMFTRRGYGWAITGGIVSIVACSLIGFPVGVWALIVLARSDVREVFRRERARPALPRSGWNQAGMAVTLICVFLLLTALVVFAFAGGGTTRGRVARMAESNPVSPIGMPDSDVRERSDEFWKESKESFPLDSHGRFSIDDSNGRIDIRGWDSNYVVLNAAIHGSTTDSVDAVKIQIDSTADQATVHTEEPSTETNSSSFWDWLFGSHRHSATVDYTIQVPRTANLSNVRSVNGAVAIDGVAGDVAASTVNGRMQIKDAAANLKLSTVNGEVSVDMISLGGGQSVALHGVNGRIMLSVPEDADATFSMTTVNGVIHSEFPQLKVTRKFPMGGDLKGHLGDGSGTVSANVVNGTIDILRGRSSKRLARRRLPSSLPAAPINAAGNSGTSNFFTAVAGMMSNPETREMVRAQQRMVIDQTYNALPISSNQLSNLRELLLDRQMAIAGPSLSVMGMNGTDAGRKSAMAGMEAARNGYDRKIRDLLGPKDYALFTNYEETLMERQQVQAFKMNLPPAAALTGHQEEDLIAAMYHERVAIPDLKTGAGLSGADRMAVSQKYLEQLRQSYLAAATSVLTPAQLEYFKQWQDQSAAVEAATLKQMFGP